MTARRLSQAISEGDGISVVVAVDGPEAAQAAELAGAEALLVPAGAVSRLSAIREATELPLLGVLENQDRAPEGADAWLVDVRGADRDGLAELHRSLADACEVALRIESEDDLEFVLDAFDPEILVLGVAAGEAEALAGVLDLLPDVPAGKLAIADVGARTRDEVSELERAGIDGVIVAAGNIADLVGAAPPEV